MHNKPQGSNSSQITTRDSVTTNNNEKNFQSPQKGVSRRSVIMDGGRFAVTCNGGELQPIGYGFVNAGDTVVKWDVNQQIRVLAPQVPVIDQMQAVVRAFFVPNSYMIQDYDKLRASKDEIGVTRNMDLPVINLANYAAEPAASDPIFGTYSQCYAWKQKVMGQFLPNNIPSVGQINVLPVRAYAAARNWFCRLKNYMPAIAEFRSQTVGNAEQNAILGTFGGTGVPNFSGGYGEIQKDVVKSNYYTNIRPRIISTTVTSDNVGLTGSNATLNQMTTGTTFPTSEFVQSNVAYSSTFLSTVLSSQTDVRLQKTAHVDWQAEIAEFRRQNADSILNDNQIIAQLGGTSVVKTDRPEYLGTKTIPLNYQQVAATNSNSAENVQLGSTGAFSVTINDETLFTGKQFLQDGVILVTVTITTDRAFENGVHKYLMYRRANEFYNPELKNLEFSTVNRGEISFTAESNNGGLTPNDIIAFNPQYQEQETLPNICARDMRSFKLKTVGSTTTVPLYLYSLYNWHTFDSARSRQYITDGFFKDDTDLVISRNTLFANANTYSNDQVMIVGKNFAVFERPIPARIEGHAQTQK